MIPESTALIPCGSPLAAGWRADLVAILLPRSLVDVMDTIAQFAELSVRREPDTARDPLDASETIFQRDSVGRPRLNDDSPLTVARAADPAYRRIDRIAELGRSENVERSPRPYVLRGHGSKLRTHRTIDRPMIGRPRIEPD